MVRTSCINGHHRSPRAPPRSSSSRVRTVLTDRGRVLVLHRRRHPGHHLLTSLEVLSGSGSRILTMMEVHQGSTRLSTTRRRLLYRVEVLLGGRPIQSHMVRLALPPVLNITFIQCYEIFILFLHDTDYTQQTMSADTPWSAHLSAEANIEDYMTQPSVWSSMFLTPPPYTQETQHEDPESFIPARNVGGPERYGWSTQPRPPPREPRPRHGRGHHP